MGKIFKLVINNTYTKMKFFNLHRSRKENQDNAIMYILMSSHKNLETANSKKIKRLKVYSFTLHFIHYLHCAETRKLLV